MSASTSGPLCLVRSSINIDSMFAVPHVVRPGETMSSTGMEERPGGKGANVSAAVALAGQPVVMSGAVGKDAQWPIDELKTRGVTTDSVRVLNEAPTGRAFIQVAEDGENSIVLLKGANFHPDPGADDPAKVFSSLPSPPTHLILQNEIPLATTVAFLRHAHASSSTGPPQRCMTVFNPSPMLTRDELRGFEWWDVDVLIVNEGEGLDLVEAMAGEGGAGKAGSSSNGDRDVLDALAALPALAATSWLVMTRGSRGVSAVVQTGGSAHRERIDVGAAKPRRVLDTTGAGDTFAGNLVAGLMRLQATDAAAAQQSAPTTAAVARDVLRWAAAAAAVAVETNGAMESIPRFNDVKQREHELLG